MHYYVYCKKNSMALNLLKDKGVSIDQQKFTWKDLVQKPISKLNDDAFTRVRIILMNGIESEAVCFGHSCARMNKELQLPLAKIRRGALVEEERHLATIRELREKSCMSEAGVT